MDEVERVRQAICDAQIWCGGSGDCPDCQRMATLLVYGASDETICDAAPCGLDQLDHVGCRRLHGGICTGAALGIAAGRAALS